MGFIDIKEVAAHTLLTEHKTGIWQATRLHKDETRAENQRHNTNTAKVLVRITDSKTLQEIRKLHSDAYAKHKLVTLPTVQDGLRLLPAGRELEHSTLMRKYGDEHNRLVREFLAAYEDERDAAPNRLNGLYDPSMWPALSEVAKKFKFNTRYLPTPTIGTWGDWLMESTRAAEAELRERLETALERVRDRCRADGRLHATVFDSIRELVELVPDLDFAGELTPVVQAMAPLAQCHAELLRDDEDLKKAAADKAANILSVLGGIK